MKKLLALISCIVICSICVIPVNANAYPILSDWAKEEAYLAEANDLFPGGEMHDDLRCAASRGQAAWYAVLLAETLLGHEIENAASGVFSDMSNSFFKNIVDKAYTAGIVNGQKDGEFHEKDIGNSIRRSAPCPESSQLSHRSHAAGNMGKDVQKARPSHP